MGIVVGGRKKDHLVFVPLDILNDTYRSFPQEFKLIISSTGVLKGRYIHFRFNINRPSYAVQGQNKERSKLILRDVVLFK